MKNLNLLNLKGLYGYRQSLLSRSPQPRDNRETSERQPSEERTLLAPLPQRFARYAAMLIMLLTLGVGQMWAATRTIYYYNPNGWNPPYCYAWQSSNTSNKNANWPGVKMTATDHKKNGKTIYKIDITNDSFDRCIFSNNGSNQTSDLSGFSNGKIYDGSNFNTTYNSSYWDAEYGSRNIYLDISNNTGWKVANGYVGFHTYYSPVGASEDYKARFDATLVEGNIYVVTASTINSAYVRSFKAARWSTSGGDDWNSSNQINANTSKNKLIVPSSGWTGCTLTWGVYVPTVSSVDFSYNVVPSSGTGVDNSHPYIVPTGTTVRVTATPTSVIDDSQCTLKYNWDNAGYGNTAYKDLSCSTNGTTYSTTVVVANDINGTKGTTATKTVYFKAVTAPTISLAVKRSSTVVSKVYSGETLTLVASPANAGATPTIVYEYSTSSTFATSTTIATTTSTSQSWTVPANTAEATLYVRARVTSSGYECTSSASALTAYGKKTIHVKNSNNWSTMYMYAWTGEGALVAWHGWTGLDANGMGCTNVGGGLWWDVVIYSNISGFCLNGNASGNDNQTADLSYSTYTNDRCLAISTTTDGDGKRTLPNSSVSCLTDASVSTTAAASILRTSATLGGNVTGNGNDKIISYGYYYTTNSTLSSSNVIGTRVEVGTDNKSGSFTKSQTGLTANTTYYVMAYAKNGNGEAYGSVQSFTTLAQYTVTTGVVTGQSARGSVSPASVTCSSAEWSSNVSASANEGYEFNSWTTGDGVTKQGTTSPTKVKATQNSTIKASFNEVLRTVGVTVNNSYLGSVDAASLTSVGPETESAEVEASNETGATFSNWTLPTGVTAAEGYSANSNPIKVNATAGSKTITANFSETMHTVTMNSADGSKGTVDASSASVGQITAVAISATPKSGYMFTRWVKTAGSGTVTYYTGAGNGQVTDASGDEKETTYICVTGDVTLQATWEPDRSSGYVVHYGNSGKNADGGSDPSQARDWKDGKLYRATTEASDVSYFTFTAGVGDVDKTIYFKIWETSSSAWDHWYGYNSNDGGKITGNVNEATLSTSYGDARLCIIMPGSYRFTWNKSTKKLSVEYPNDVYYLRGGFNGWSWAHPMTETSSGVYSATVNMTEANHTYSGDNGFKVLIAGQYYGKNSTTFTRTSSTGSAAVSGCNISGANMGLTTDYTGDYTFTYNTDGDELRITYPTAYKVTYGKGSVDGSASDCSAVDITNGGTAVTSNSTWVKSGNQVVLTAPAAKSGYRYLGWYDNNSATGDAITTNANCTITVSSALTRYACYAENLSSITVSAGTGGTVTTGSGTHSLGVTTTQAINASASNGYSWSTWTTTGNAALGTTATTASNTAKGNGTNGGSGTVVATFTPNDYDIILDVNGGSGDNQTVTATFAAAMPTVQKGGSTPIAARTKTGYNFDGYTKNNDGTGTKYYTAALASNANLDIYVDETHIYAKWDAKQSTLSFDYQTSATGYGTSGSVTAASKATYDAAMPSLSGTMPTAAQGYAFTGFYDATSGGTKYYNADGTSAHAWDKDTESGTTLYARWEKAEITNLALDAATVEPEATVGVTPTISPTPAGTTIICWEVQYAATGNPLSPQPGMKWSAGKLTFDAPAASGLYKIVATLKTGDDCDGGTTLSSSFVNFQVAGSHTVTVAYKHSGTDIAASTSVTGRPLDWSDPITAPDIFGYTFDHWTAGDGITLSENGTSDLGDDESDEETIYIKATYDGTLTANYTPKNIVYFKDNLGWTDPDDENAHIYVNLLQSDYWNNDRGSGNQDRPNRNLEMSRVPGTTDIFYYEYNDKSTSNYISFTKESMGNSGDFYQAAPNFAHVVFPSRSLDDLSTNKSTGLGFYAATPMFVPLATQTPVKKNSGRAAYYNDGYWTKYLPGTGYSLDIYQSDGKTRVKIVEFTSADELMPMKVTTDLEGGHTYKFQLKRDGDVYYGNSGTMTYNDHGQNTAWEFNNSPFSMCTIETNAAGNYTFNLSFSPNSGGTNNRLRISVDYPVASGDYRLVYTDDVHTKIHPSAIVPKENNGTAIVSFFVRHDQNPEVRIQQATVNPSTGAITWNEYPNSGTPTNQITGTIESAITAGGTEVYNFNLSMNESGAMTVASAEIYEGNFYIRTDAANSKWDNYRTDPDHLMTYSEYSIEHGGYTHYYTHWVDKDVTGRKNVKFVIANDYSPCISDTLIRETATGTWANIDKFIEEGGDLKRSANVRFMWDKRDNSISRAYIDGAQGDYSSNFLYMLNVEGGADKIKKEDDTALTDHKVTFKDNGNWMYEANIKAQPTAQIKLLSNWGTSNTITQYFRGAADDTETLIGGSGSTWYDIRLIYDFKTNRLIAGLIPSGTIDDQMAIHADVMFVREHQGDIAQLTFAEKAGKMGAITDIETAYGVLQFNKWTLNNKSKADGHSPLSPLLSAYERDLFYVSFPFRVSMEEVFGFGTYGTHWIIEEYDGASRAANGYWQESGPNWKFVFNRKNKFFEPGQGYIIALDLDELGESSDVWTNTDQVELYFPSYGTMDNITSSSATYEIPSHLCTINRTVDASGNPTGLPADYDRRVKDSHWNVLGVPTYVNPLAPNFANTDWTTSASETSIGPNFLYQVNWTDNSVSPVSASGYTYHAMHAYLVQYCGDVTWTSSVSVALSDIVARRMSAEKPQNVEFKMELSQNDKMVDQTFIKLSDDEHVTTGFEFNYDLSKEFNANKANIYTLIEKEPVAGNVLPLTEQITVIPVGVKIAANGDYTFAIPEGTDGIGITLIDNETGIRTSLSALDYTINLPAGTYNERFLLEISPIRPISTDLENTEYRIQNTDVRKVLIDGILYVVKDGVMYDAQGKRLQ